MAWNTPLIPDSGIASVFRPNPDEPALIVAFTLGATPYLARNSGPPVQHTEAAAIVVSTQDPEETNCL